MEKTATNIRFPRDLHTRVKDLAWKNRTSLNDMINRLVTEALDARDRQRNEEV